MLKSRGDSGGFGPASGPDLRILDGIASWCGGLHGSMSLSEALRALAKGFSADAAAITRHHRSEADGRAVAIFDVRDGEADCATLKRALCRDVLGSHYGKARVATAWFMSDHVDEPDWTVSQTLGNWRIARGMAEIIVIPLAASHLQQDYIEFHFAAPLSRSERHEFEALVPTIVRSWGGRKTGLVTQARMDERIVRAREMAAHGKMKWDAPILGMSNPAKLSRAEFRVCLLLSRGLSVKGVTDELGLSEATIRTHLRSIYSKTETSGLPELLYRILSSGSEAAEAAFGTN